MDITPGRSWPLGATQDGDGVNFSLWSRHATSVELCLFDRPEDGEPARLLRLDPAAHRTYHYWHVHVAGLRPGQLYGWRVHGPYDPAHGYRFDGRKLLLDPYARAVAVPTTYDRRAAARRGDNAGQAMKGVVVDLSRYDWEGDRPLRRGTQRSVIYEMHVRGFTRHESSGVAPERRGTFAGLVEKIPYLRDLGVTSVELMPVFQFDAQDASAGLVNYWGYSPVSFFAPHAAYASAPTPQGALDEFRDMVKALHRADIAVILDVVFNHSAEGDETGPTLSFRGLDNRAYYILDDFRRYANFTGCGNTLKSNHPVVRRLMLDSLRHWVSEMHVDGFRFDLASVLSRDTDGNPVRNAPALWDIESDPVLSGTKLIAEAWDAGGLYQVGHFVGDSWKEWNGRFRDDVRSFLRGDPGLITPFANRLLGSPDLYERKQREPEQSVNFVTCHDGLTLNDLVTYGKKRNLANGEGNRDGSDHELSWNCGVEGPSDDPAVEALRNRMVKNFLAVNLISAGIPMLLMGDEMRRTQRGNNNAWCQDGDLSWLDWRLLVPHADVHRFVRRLIRLRSAMHTGVRRTVTLTQFLRRARIRWHGVKLDAPDWSEGSHSLAGTFQELEGPTLAHVIVNAWKEPLAFELPRVESGWRVMVDTALPSPDDVRSWEEAPVVKGATYQAADHSVVFLSALAPGEVILAGAASTSSPQPGARTRAPGS
ncbi:MAG: glycogen debranching protein GlgX [Deltaproteobacteria bacterium]